jgi:DNA-binding Lrp family transcriptional regulator
VRQKTSNKERKILAVIQHGMPVSLTPYKDMAQKAGLETAQLLEVLKDWKEKGKLRRIGAIIDHFKVGLSTGVMVSWCVKPDRIEEVARILTDFSEVSHAYERSIAENWPYNIYTMVHGSSTEQVSKTIGSMSQACGINDYRELATEKELKKVPPTYVGEN